MCEHRFPGKQNVLKGYPFLLALSPGPTNIVVRHIPGPTQSLFLHIGVYFRPNSEQRLPKSKYDRFHQYLVVNSDFSENKRPQKKIKTVTMDKTL